MDKGKRILSMLMVVVVLFSIGGNYSMISAMEVDAQANINWNEDIYKMECMQPYLEIIMEINNLYKDADMAIPTEDVIRDAHLSKKSIVEFYLSMEIDEFRNYLMDLYDNKGKSMTSSENAIMPFAYSKTQRYVFKNGNYLYFCSTVYIADGAERYSDIGSIGFGYSTTPYYKASSREYTFKDSYKKVKMTFKNCYQYYSSNVLCTTTPKNFTATFKASGGDYFVSANA